MAATSENFKRHKRIKARWVSTNSEVHLLAVMDKPSEIARSQTWIEKTVKRRRTFERDVLQHIFDSDDPFGVLVKAEMARDARFGAVRPNQILSSHSTRRLFTVESHN